MAGMWQDQVLMVIPSINGGHLLARMLPTLRFPPCNVIVLDQGSTDKTGRICADAGVELVQLGSPRTYTEACNIGARMAGERGRKYLCVSNNDIVFRTDVLAELSEEMERDPKLGIVAPSQIVNDELLDRQSLTCRVFWDLQTLDFVHDLHPVDSAVSRLEADFCELTLALVRMSAVDEIGFLDDEYGFYHEDADFGFRLRRAGYSCAYLPKSQIEHFSGSTFNEGKSDRKAAYVAKNKIHFAKKHLGYGVHHELDGRILDNEQNVLGRSLHSYLRRYGLINRNAPELAVAHPGAEFSGYLLTTFDAPHLPARWAKYDQRYRAIFATSARTQKLLTRLGLACSFHIPFGIESDIFCPWGPTRRIYDETTYLAIVDGQHHDLLRALLTSWHRFASSGKPARLILLGRALHNCLGRSPDRMHRSGDIDVFHYGTERVDVHEILSPISDHHLAQLYRAVDYAVLDRTRDGWNLNVLQSMACGVPSIFGGLASEIEAFPTDDLAPVRLPLASVSQPEQITDSLVNRFEESLRFSAGDRAALANDAVYRVRGQHTLRHTTMSLYGALARLQDPNPAEIVQTLERRRESIISGLIRPDDAILTATLPTGRLSGFAARRLTTAGHLVAQFGSVWQEKGLAAATKSVTGELRYFLARRSGQISRLKDGALNRAWTRIEWLSRSFAHHAPPKAMSALLIGYIDAQLGLGQSLRGLASAMSQSATQFKIYPFTIGVEGRRSAPYMPERYDVVHPHAVNVIEVTPDELPTVFRNVDRSHFDRSFNILRTYWELSKAPEVWRSTLGPIDELWAPNAFVAASFRTIFDRPIVIVPPCIEPPVPEPGGHRLFDLDEHRFHFLFSFDYFSFPQRKNPLAVVRAFRAAFPDLSSPVGLIIKSAGSIRHSPQMKEELQDAARYDSRIRIIDESLSRQEMLSLIVAVDCYVSMHRSEGFGLGMAEAMALGKPVIATNYSGNTDFLSDQTGYPVPYVLIDVAPDEYVHTEGQVWADPDEDACAAAMRRVFINREEAAAKAAAAQQFVAERYGPVAVGSIVERRLNEIFQLGPVHRGRTCR